MRSTRRDVPPPARTAAEWRAPAEALARGELHAREGLGEAYRSYCEWRAQQALRREQRARRARALFPDR